MQNKNARTLKMKLAVLMTNTDESVFAQKWPKDGEKFSNLVHKQRPNWSCEVFSVKDGHFPEDIQSFDGAMITGSPASVHDDEAWLAQLFDLIRQMDARGVPVFGACFGHQAIALALGGSVSRNPNGWVHGFAMTESVGALPFAERDPQIGQYASHIEQVIRLPKECTVIAQGPDCAIGGFMKGQHIFTTQYHPEMSDAFITDLVEETADYVGAEVTATARASLSKRANNDALGRQIVQFFEWAVKT